MSEAEVARFGVPIVTVVLIFDSLAVRERRFWNLAFENKNIFKLFWLIKAMQRRLASRAWGLVV